MTPEISERAFEEAIECALLRNGPDASRLIHEVEEEDDKGKRTGKRFLIFPR